MPQGFSLNVGVEVLKRLDEADKNLQDIAKHSEDVAKSMSKLSNTGFQTIVDSLNKANQQLTAIAENKGFSNLNQQASQNVDAINQMIAALAKLQSMQELKIQTQQSKVDYKKQKNDIKELAVAEDERARALDRQNKANIANNKSRQALETKRLANDTKQLMNVEQERGRQLILQNQKSIAAYAKQSTKLKQQIDEINRLAKAYKQMPKSINQRDLNKIINSASKTKTINQYITAIHNLKNALNDLDRTSPRFRQNFEAINKQIQRNTLELAKLGINLDNVRNKKRRLMDTAGQLQRRLALLFSVSQIAGYINKLVGIRREMELQHRSLQVLIQDRFEAEKLWQQTVDLAVRSPFRVKELVTYTKNLAAYRIETDKLHETTKRLADVSAGLGVDMQRLILAYGQVRAAEYLRGTELRQFSEAGIPMLDELSKYFSDLEGRAVSAGDVFERISKRMVSFEDVAEVFKRITNEGGVFFQMQEKQAETLHGVISNFHDSVDLMLNDIGQANDGLLKDTVMTFRGFIENWRLFAEILKQVAVTAGLIALRGAFLKLLALSPKIYAMAGSINAMNIANRALSIKMSALIGSIKALGTALTTSMLGWLAIASAVTSAISAIIAYKDAIDEANKKYDELSTREVDAMRKLEKLNDKIEENNQKIKESNEQLKNINITSSESREATDKKTKAEKENGKILDELKQKYPLIYQGLKQQEDGTLDTNKALKAQNDLLRINIALQQQAKGSAFQEDFSENYKESLEKYQKVITQITLIQSRAYESAVDFNQALNEGVIDEKTFKSFDEIFKKFTDVKDYESVVKLNKELNDLQNSFKGDQWTDLNRLLQPIKQTIVGLRNVQDSYKNDLDDWFGNIDNQMSSFEVMVNKVFDNIEDENLAKVLAGDEIKATLEKLGVVNEALRKEAEKYIQSKLTVQVDFETKKDEEYVLVEEWRKKVWDAIQEVQKTNPEIRLGVSMKEMATKDKAELIKKIKESVENAKKINQETIDVGEIEVQVAFNDQQIEDAKKAKPLLDFLGQLVGLLEKTNNTTTKDWTSEVVKGIKDAHQEYIKLNKTLSSTESKQMALAKYADLFKEAAQHTRFKNMNLKDIDFTTEKGTIKALEDMLNKLPKSAKQARITIQKALKEIRGEQTISFKIKEDQKILDQIEEMFSGYEMSIELEKLNIPPDLAKQLFNVDTLTLPELRQQVISELSKGAEEGSFIVQQELNKSIDDVDWDLITAWLGEDQMKKAKETLTKVNEMEEKAQEERLKKYAKYLVKAQSDRIKAKVEEMRQIQEIEDTFKMTEGVATERFGMDSTQWKQYQNLKEINKEELKRIGLTNKQIEQILEYNEQMRVSAQLAKEGVKKETQEKVDKAVWEEFKGSAMYEQLFGDLENLGTKSIDVLMDRLEKMKEALKQLPPEVYKEIQTQLDKLGELKMERNPFSEFKKAFKDIEELQKKRITYTNDEGKEITLKGEDAIVYEMQLEQEKAEKIREQLTLYKQIYEANGDINKLTEVGVSLTDEQNELLGDNKAINDKILELQGDLAKAEDEAKKKGQDVQKYKKARESLTKVQEATTAWGDAISGVLGGMDEILDAFGVAEDDSSRLWIQGAQQIANMIVQVVLLSSALKAMGVAANAALGVIGWIATALTAVATIFASIFAAGDKKKEREIERQIENVEKLEKSYKRLEKAIDDAYSINTLQTSNKEAQKNLKNQIDAYDKMIQAEEAKKKTDKDRIKEWKNTQDELREQMQELREEVVSTATDGILDNVLDAAQAFTDAWYEAFKETGDGLSGLEENFTEVMQNLVKRQASMLITQQWVNKWKSELNKYLNPDDLTLTAQEAGLWVDEVKKSLPQLSDALDNYFKAMQQAGVDLMSGELSGLQKGIQGITEQQADILAAYLNSIRFFVSDNNNYLSQIAASFNNTEIENPMVEQLRVIASQTSAINTLLQGLVKGGHSLGGQGFKVFIS